MRPIQQLLANFLDERLLALHTVLDKPGHRLTMNDFHILRVEIKKLRAVMALLDYCASDFPRKKQLAPFRIIFKRAGRIREYQLELSMLRRFKAASSMPDYHQQLRKALLEEKKHFVSIAHRKRVHRLDLHIEAVKDFLPEVTLKKLLAFVREKRKKITALLEKQSLGNAETHELRKRLKQLYFLIQLFELPVLGFPDIEGFMTLIGQWHDLAVMGSHLQRAVATGSHPGAETDKMVELKSRIQMQAAAKKRDLLLMAKILIQKS